MIRHLPWACALLATALGCQGQATSPGVAMAPVLPTPPGGVNSAVAGGVAVAPPAQVAGGAVAPQSAGGAGAPSVMPQVPPTLPTAGSAAMAGMPQAGQSAGACKYVRKSGKRMTAQERETFVTAVVKLKEVPSPFNSAMNYYDQFVTWHTDLQRCDPKMQAPMMMAHAGPMLLPWHREHLLLFDDALRSVSDSKTVTTPYWDWTDPDIASIFSEDFMGGTGDTSQNNAVMNGPFRKDKFMVRIDPVGLVGGGSPFVQRFLGPPGMLPKPAEVESALAIPFYDAAPWDLGADPNQSFRQRVEGNRGKGGFSGGTGRECPSSGVAPLPIGGTTMHNAIHSWVGGSMQTSASTNDPVFWLHHAMVDRIWDMWQQKHGVDTYLPTDGYPNNNVNDEMSPFDASGIHVTPAMVADNRKFGVCYE